MFEYLLFSMHVTRNVWSRELDWMLFVRECMLWLPSERTPWRWSHRRSKHVGVLPKVF